MADPIRFAPRKIYENEHTSTAEREIVQAVVEAWKLDPRIEKLPYFYSVDFVVYRDDRIAALVEAKTREKYRHGFCEGGYNVGAYRLTKGQEFAQAVGLPLWLAIRFAGPKIYRVRIDRLDFRTMEKVWFGPTVPRDGDDAEMCVVLPWDTLQPLTP